jgi:hypothetical protein
MSGARFWTPPAFGGPPEPPRIPVPRPITRQPPMRFPVTPPNSVQSPVRIMTPPELRHLVPMFGARRSLFGRAPSPVHYLPRVKLFLDVREPNALICPICQEPFSMLAIVTDLRCNHLIHHNCLVEWIFQHNSCPLCRGPVTTR